VAAGAGVNGIETAVLQFDPTAPHSLTAEVPSFLGGGSLEIDNFTGQVTASLHRIPNDFEHAVIRINAGSFSAPSVRLPAGLETGPNTLTFGPATQSEGVLDLTTGAYTATATAVIVNDLFPHGLRVRGQYSGTYDPAAGRVSVASNSTDHFGESDQLQVNRTLEGMWLTWTLPGVLETAPVLFGPWVPMINAASPLAVDPLEPREQYFRVRLPGP
jgi:hypothetical protein